MKATKPDWPIIILMAIIKFMLPFVLQDPVWELQRDEFLYYQQGLHPALGYMENPPLLSWLGTVSSWLGGTAFWIKCWPALTGSLTLIITCLITGEFGGKRFAQFLSALGIIVTGYMRVHSLFQPNIVDIFFWTLAIYFLVRYVNSNDEKNIYFFTISLALGFLSKYSVLFIVASILLSLLLTYHRKIFTRINFYLAGGLAVLIILPNILWQYNHRWPLIHHMRELQETQLQYLSAADFIKDQLLMLFPVLLVWTAGVIWLFRRNQWRFLSFTFILVLLFLIAGSGKSYYSLGIYPMLLAAGAVYWEKIKWRWAIPILAVILIIPLIPLLLPIWKPERLAKFYRQAGIDKIGFLKWEDQQNHPLPQDFADMLGWRELAEKSENFYRSLPDSVKQHTVVYCRNYGQAGALKFYGKANDFTECVFSDNGSFLLWVPEEISFKHLLLIGERMPDRDDEVFQHFQSARIVDSVTNQYSRQLGDKVIFFENADSLASRLARDGLNAMKQEFRR